jgi:hypothetical protein
MSSWLKCKCGQLIHKNLFCGTGISLVVTEEFLHDEHIHQAVDSFVDSLIISSSMLLKCKACGRLVILKERPQNDLVEFYMPECSE